MVRQEGLCPMTPSGIEPVTLQLLAQCINQLRHRVHPGYWGVEELCYGTQEVLGLGQLGAT
jgi:hypothetical protein